jgi:short-subunit dehydrogenase
MPTALITGPTAGIGAEFARQLAATGHDLVLVSRDATRLDETASELRAEYGVTVDVLPADLSTDAGMTAVEERLRSEEGPVDLLVNNAGFALRKPFLANDIADELDMHTVLVVAVMRLAHAVLPGMIQRGHGAVVNVSSTAGWLPRGTYSAAKAWATSFSVGLTTATAGTGVHVMALAPGFVRTEFHSRAGMKMSGLPSFMWLDADKLVADALRDLRRGKVVSVPGRIYKVAAWLLPRLPRRLVMSIGTKHPADRNKRPA